MDTKKKKKLEAAGFAVGDAQLRAIEKLRKMKAG